MVQKRGKRQRRGKEIKVIKERKQKRNSKRSKKRERGGVKGGNNVRGWSIRRKRKVAKGKGRKSRELRRTGKGCKEEMVLVALT